MKPDFSLHHCALAAMLLCSAMESSALTLGRARGAALLGQPFQMTVPVQLAADEDGSGLCFEADVFYGENKQEGSRVSVSAERNASGQPTTVRIQARAPVDEPVVSVYLRSGCGVSTSRRYVLLADLASEVTPPAPGVAPLVRSPLVAVPVAPTTAPAVAPADPVMRSSAVLPSAGKPAATVRKAAPRAEVPPPSNKVVSGKSRLKLTPLDLSQDWDPALKSSSELLAPPVEDVQKRLAAAALWKSLNLTPEEVLRDAARLQGLEQNVGKLTEQTAQNQRQMQDLVGRLEKSESEKYANPVIFGLLGILLALGGGMLWFWRKLRNAGDAPWWSGQESAMPTPPVRETTAQDIAPVQVPPSEPALPVAAPAAPALRTQAVARVPTAVLADIDIDLHLDDLAPSPAPQPPLDRPSSRMMGLRDFSPSMSGTLRSINTQEMLDVRQQADFFMTLGQYDEAISLLEHNIADHAESNPLVYLDLLKALHTLSRKEAFDRYSEEFNALFTGQVPPYAQFNQPGRGLEAYPELCAHIASVWPSRAALDFIEKCLVRERDAAVDVRFDLEAFRDLLLLHALVTRLSGEVSSGVAPFSAAKPSEAPFLPSAETGPAPVEAALPRVDAPSVADIDLDLSDATLAPTPSTDGNLIDFDASGLSLTPPLSSPRR